MKRKAELPYLGFAILRSGIVQTIEVAVRELLEKLSGQAFARNIQPVYHILGLYPEIGLKIGVVVLMAVYKVTVLIVDKDRPDSRPADEAVFVRHSGSFSGYSNSGCPVSLSLS